MQSFASANWGWFALTTLIMGILTFALGSNLGRTINMHEGEATGAMWLAYPAMFLFAASFVVFTILVIIAHLPI